MENLTIPANEPLIFLEREHHDTRHAVSLDTNRVKHGFISIISKLARNLLGRDRQQRFSHTSLLDLLSHPLDGVPLAVPSRETTIRKANP